MAEVGLTQLQMMLVRQGGFGTLPLSILPASNVLTFIRTAEQLCLDTKLSPIIIYWSKHKAENLLPDASRLKQLVEESKCLSVFSENNLESADEWCVLIESNKFSLVVYGQECGPDKSRYQCAGSMDTELVKQSFAKLLPKLQLADPVESNRLEDARVGITYGDSVVSLTQRLKSKWPIVKSPSRQNFVITPALQEAIRQNVTLKAGSEKRPGDPPASATHTKLPDSPPVVPQQKPISAKPGQTNINQTDFKPDTPNTDTGGHPITYHGETTIKPAKVSSVPRQEITTEVKPIVHGLPRQAINAQTIIAEIISRLRHSHNLNAILQFAIEKLAQAVNADRGLIWQVVGDQLAVTHEYSANGNLCFISNRPLHSDESAAIVLEFVNHFPDESATGVISINDTTQDNNLHKISPTLSSLIELGGVKARLMVQLRSRGVFFGFLELQQSNAPRIWGSEEAMMIQTVAEMLSVVVQQSYDQSRIEVDAREMKLINDIASLFRESRGQSSEQSLVKSVLLVADHMGFIHAQLYLYHPEEDELVPQIRNGENANVPLTTNDNPFVSVFKSGRGKVINVEESKKGDPYFKHDMALILPLSSEGERLGVIGLWQRQSTQTSFRAQDRELGLTIAGHLSNVIRAETAVMQIKAEQARAALINKVSSEIRQSLKEVDQIMATLVESLKDHFNLGRCLVALYDHDSQQFTKFKMSCQPVFNPSGDGTGLAGADKLSDEYLEWQLFNKKLQELRLGNIVFLNQDELRQAGIENKEGLIGSIKAATLVPLLYGGEFKATLCLLHTEQASMLPRNDMNMITDVSDRVAAVISHAELFGQIHRQAVTDPMTGLFNRRYFQEQLTKEIDRYQRFGHPFSLIIADLDLLKRINDTVGHPGGDLAIKHIANVMRDSVRDVDTVGRFGGEEFVVLLPETEQKQARLAAERICAGIRETAVEGVGTITASLGVATYPNDATEYNKLFELADQSLLLAKRNGRNRVCSASEELLPSLLNSKNLPPAPQPSFSEAIPTMASALQPLAEPAISSINLTLVARRGLIGLLSLLAKAIEELDMYEPGRSEDVYNYARKMAETLNLSSDRIEMIALAAVYSNLGKLILPKEILKKEGPLTSQEMEIVKSHPSAGARLLETAKLVVRMAPIVEAYQENWDGSGYPLGLKGEEIPIESRIVALVNDFVAMISNRPYRAGLSEEEALRLIESKSGKDYDPQLAQLFLSLLGHDSRAKV